MRDTYTYTARSIEHPEQAVTMTLHDDSMSVGLGAPVEQIERALRAGGAKEVGKALAALPLKPLAMSLIEEGVGPFHIADVDAEAEGSRLRVRAWYRAGLELLPVTLVDGEVDNPVAAHDFANEVEYRQAMLEEEPGLPGLLDFWITWIAGVLAVFALAVILMNRDRFQSRM